MRRNLPSNCEASSERGGSLLRFSALFRPLGWVPSPANAMRVSVAMVQIGVVWMRMADRLVPVPVRMRLRARRVIRVPMVLVVKMAVLVLERFVFVHMLMPLGEVHP